MNEPGKKFTAKGEHPTASSMLLAGAKTMDPVAWSRLVDTFGGIVYRWCRTSGVAQGDAADVVQDVFASVARGIGRFEREKTEGSFRSWLATITRNRVRDHLRKQVDRERAVGGTDAWKRLQEQAESVDAAISDDQIQNLIVRKVLDGARAEFEPATWTAFWKTAVEARPAADVAQELGMTLTAVYKAKSRVLSRLRAHLGEVPE